MFQPATITQPGGAPWKTGSTCGSVFIEPDAAPSSGTYTIGVDPGGAATGSVRMYVYDVVDLTGSLTLNATAVPVSIGQRGQVARYTVNLPAGQVTVRMTNNGIGWTTVTLLKPDGSPQASVSSGVSSFNLPTQTLAAAATYTVVIDPNGAGMGTISVRVTSP
jgi:hypothetical protein